MSWLAIKQVDAVGKPDDNRQDRGEAEVRIVWKGKRISKLIFSGGKTVEFTVS